MRTTARRVVLASALTLGAAACGGSSTLERATDAGGDGTSNLEDGTGAGGDGSTLGACDPERFRPGACAPTYDEQLARPLSEQACTVDTYWTWEGDAYRGWYSFTGAFHDELSCLYDKHGLLLGEKLCSINTVPDSCMGPPCDPAKEGYCPSGPQPICVYGGRVTEASAFKAPGNQATSICPCTPPEKFQPGSCLPTWDQQLARPATCGPTKQINTRDCGGFHFWSSDFSYTLDILSGNPVQCVYDSQGALVGEKICTTTYELFCPVTSAIVYCHTAGTIPTCSDPNAQSATLCDGRNADAGTAPDGDGGSST